MKQSIFGKQGQEGFTLLELLIVVTIIAILSVGAILAYDGLTDKAQSATAANNTVTADQSIRNFRAVTGNYPNQWDLLVTSDTGAPFEFVADETYFNLATLAIPDGADSVASAVIAAFDEVGIDELQVRDASGTDATTGVEPNLQFNEGATNGASEEIEFGDDGLPFELVVIPTAASDTLCDAGGGAPAAIGTNTILDGSAAQNANVQNYMTKVNDNLGENNCHLIVALGFGHDAAHSTAQSNVAIAAAPAYVSNKINPADTYARYIALFDLGEDEDGDFEFQPGEIHPKARFVGIIDPEGNVIDENVAAANDEGQEEEED